MKINRVLLILILAMFVSTGVFASNQDIKIFIDDVELKTDTSPRVVNDRTLVPLREIFEAMGATVNWDNSTKTITALKNNDEISLNLGNVKANINGREITLDTPALATNGVTLVPVRFVAESFGANVYWNKQYRTVYIDSGNEMEKDEDYEVSQFTNSKYFEFDKSMGEITGYSKEGPKDVVIPDRIAGRTVISIGNKAFDYKELESIKIPNSILNIGNEAFANNNLTKLSIPGNVTYLGEKAFALNKINTLKIAKGVATLDNGVFKENNLTTVHIPESVRSICDYAFANNKLKTVSFIEGVSSIGAGAFMDNNLTTANIPKSVMNIGAHAYKENSLTTVHVPWYIKLDSDVFDNWVNIIRR